MINKKPVLSFCWEFYLKRLRKHETQMYDCKYCYFIIFKQSGVFIFVMFMTMVVDVDKFIILKCLRWKHLNICGI